MHFLIHIGGQHTNGHEGRSAFEKIVNGFVDSLSVAGFHVEHTYACHDELPLGASEVTPLNTDTPPTETSGEQAATLTIDFASSAAAELADHEELTDTDFVGFEPSGKTGFTSDDVRAVLKARG